MKYPIVQKTVHHHKMNRTQFKRKIVELEAIAARLAKKTSLQQRSQILRIQDVISAKLDQIIVAAMSPGDITTITKRVELTNLIRSEMTNLSISQKASVDKLVTTIYNTNRQEISKLFNRSFDVTNDYQVKALMNVGVNGKPYSSRIYSNNNIIGERINKDITRMLYDKANPYDIKQALRKDLDISWNAADRLVRTEGSRFYNTAALDSYKDAGLQEVEWLTEQDDRLCEICGPLDGQRFPINSTLLPPNDSHVNCRCTVLPVIE